MHIAKHRHQYHQPEKQQKSNQNGHVLDLDVDDFFDNEISDNLSENRAEDHVPADFVVSEGHQVFRVRYHDKNGHAYRHQEEDKSSNPPVSAPCFNLAFELKPLPDDEPNFGKNLPTF